MFHLPSVIQQKLKCFISRGEVLPSDSVRDEPASLMILHCIAE